MSPPSTLAGSYGELRRARLRHVANQEGNYVDDKGTSLNGLAGRDGHKKTLVLSVEYFLSKRTSINAALFSNRFSDGYKLEANNLAGLSRDPTASSVTGYSTGIVHVF